MNVAMTSSPFQREVREWQRIDPNTGALLTGRLEADRWNNGSANKYGKVVDSQNISTPNGMRLQQRKELEVLQTRTGAGSLQVVRSSTIQTSSSRTKMPSISDNATESGQLSPKYLTNRTSPLSQLYNKSSALNAHSSSRSSLLSGYDRGRSASTDDMSINYDNDHSDDDESPMEWRRVSKIRRSLQYPKSEARRYSSRPTDLPANSVNISQIKRELQIGHRLNSPTASYVKRSSLESNGVAVSQELCPITSEAEAKQIIKKASLIQADSLQGIRNKLKRLSDESLYKDDMVTTPEDPETNIKDSLQASSVQAVHGGSHKIVSNSGKSRESIPADWYLRRKSYGFEDMPSQPDSSMSRMETSTDSGLGRSGEIASIWSSAIHTSASDIEPKPRGTIITLSGQLDDDAAAQKQIEGKRHSIAFDESKYVKDTKSLIHLNGLNSKEWNMSSSNLLDENGRRSKRVEFCKTEVHFAAESGRVNIVETDGKPPSTNNFRRRRRTSSGSNAYSEASGASTAVTGASNVMHFGDETRKELLPSMFTANENEVKITVSEHTVSESIGTLSSVVRHKEDTADELLDEISLRGILKNKPVKPRPYHLGENLENSERLWGIRLKPVGMDENVTGPRESDADERDYGMHQAERMPNNDDHTKAVTRIKLNATTKHFPWEEKDDPSHPNHTATASVVELATYPAIVKIPNETSSKLKSTSLIMKTIKSANQFDEAMKNLTIFESSSRSSADNTRSESRPAVRRSQSPSLDTMTTKTITTNFQDSSSSSMYSEGSIIKLNNLSDSSTSSSLSSMATHSQQPSEQLLAPSKMILLAITDRFNELMHDDGKTVTAPPIAAPRIKKIGSSTTGLSHQLSQLRRIYEAADQECFDDAVVDNEVKHFLANSSKDDMQPTNDAEATTELSGSWSRVRARRNITKQYNKQHEKSTVLKTEELNLLSAGQNSNLMSITLHSPTEPLQEIEFNDKPIAKPRTTNPIRNVTSTSHVVETTSLTDTKETSQPDSFRQRDPIRKFFNKIDIRPVGGARKLKDHELSYFGVKTASSSTAAVKRTGGEPSSKRNMDGQLYSDKPDLLLNHTPPPSHSSKPLSVKIEDEKSNTNDIGPIYENLRPSQYELKMDLKKNEDSLRELNETADEINKYVFADKEKPQRKSRSKPFDTIKEEDASQQQKRMHSKGVQVSRGYNHTLHKIKPLHRTSSASSTESIISVGRTQRNRVSVSGDESRRVAKEKTNNERNSQSSSKSSRRHNVSPSEAIQVIVSRSSSRRRDNLSSRENSAEDVRSSTQHHRSRRSTSGKVKPEVIRYHNSQISNHDPDRSSVNRRSTNAKSSAGSTKVKSTGSTDIQSAQRSRHSTPASEQKAASSVATVPAAAHTTQSKRSTSRQRESRGTAVKQ